MGEPHEFSMCHLMGLLNMMGIFVLGCEWSRVTLNSAGQSCLKAQGAKAGFTAG